MEQIKQVTTGELFYENKLKVFRVIIQAYTLILAVITFCEFGVGVFVGGGMTSTIVFLGVFPMIYFVFKLNKFNLSQLFIYLLYFFIFTYVDIQGIHHSSEPFFISFSSIFLSLALLLGFYIFCIKKQFLAIINIPSVIVVIGIIILFLVIDKLWSECFYSIYYKHSFPDFSLMRHPIYFLRFFVFDIFTKIYH